MTQNNLGIALSRLGERQGAPRGAAAGRGGRGLPARPSPSRTRDDLPQDWAMTQNNLGTRAPEPGRAAGGRRRGAAAGRGGRGLPAGPHRLHPRRPAPGLGHDPEQPGHRAPEPGRAAGGRRGARRLAEAVEAYRQALAVYTRDDLPQDWARTQNNLGIALRIWASGRGAPEGRGGWPRRSRPTAWPSPSTPATTSPRTGPRPRTTWASRSGAWASGRGAPRGAAAGRGGRGLPPGPHRLHPRRPPPALGHDPEQPGHRAPEPGRAAGGRRRGAAAGRGGRGLPPGPHRLHPRRPPPGLGQDPEQPGHRARGVWASGRGAPEGRGGWPRRSEAYRQALTVYTRDDLPQDWATTQNNLGIALSGLGERQGGAGGAAAAGRGGRGLPPGPHRLHPRRPPPGLGHDPEQPGHRALGAWASGRGAPEGRGGWPRRSRPTARPSPSAPATTSPRTGP